MITTSSSARIAHEARVDFDRARRRAFLSDLAALMRRRPNWLISYTEVERELPIQGQVYRGVRTIPLAAVRGSVDRYHDFDRNFLPKQAFTRARWESVDRAGLADISLPAIEVYQVGEVYFVKDGNHRVSVARRRGMEYIDADVIECQTLVPLAADTDPRDLLRLAEYARFLESTHLDKLRPGCAIEFTALGRYDLLREHISAHRWFLGVTYGRPFAWDEAVLSWYDTVYRPLVAVIRSYGVMDLFPHRTEGDLYLWIVEHRYYLSLQQGAEVDSATAVQSFARDPVGMGRKAVRRLARTAARAAGRLAHLAHPFAGVLPVALCGL
jgi:hypothetical protein